ncbi:S-methyl-5'-thioinosine phosphorylase [Pseudomonadota bacterium]
MTKLAIIGGSGFTQIKELEVTRQQVVNTPFGNPSTPVTFGQFGGIELAFLPRHGGGHTIPPHMINYRANIWALKEIGAERVISMAAVGGIRKDMAPGCLAIPDQIIDYTWGRAHTFFEKDLAEVTHVDFTEPYDQELRERLIGAGKSSGVGVIPDGTYGAMQGPRLESAAEINRMERDGCAMVGMTGMPEAALAREAELSYAACAVVANWAAGRGDGPITMEQILAHLEGGLVEAKKLLLAFAAEL